MKKNKYHIIRTWVLLICFVAGQYMVYAHQHVYNAGTNKATYHKPGGQPRETLTENCQLCDAMHHNVMATITSLHFAPVVVSTYTFKAVDYTFISIAIIHSAGRAPPLA